MILRFTQDKPGGRFSNTDYLTIRLSDSSTPLTTNPSTLNHPTTKLSNYPTTSHTPLPRLAYHRHANLPRVVHRLLDLLGDVARQAGGGQVVLYLPARR